MGFGYTKAVYETFMGRKDLLNATQLSVLLALAYSANNTTGACYPGKARLGQLTLLGQSTVDQACRELKNKNIITIDERRVDARYNKTNVYTFPFLTWNRETRYQTVQQSATPQQLTHPPRQLAHPPPVADPPLPRQLTPNQEITNLKSEEKPGLATPSSMVAIGSVLKSRRDGREIRIRLQLIRSCPLPLSFSGTTRILEAV